MQCELCGGLVTWRGPLSALTHTECESCGGQNCQVVDVPPNEDEPCPAPLTDDAARYQWLARHCRSTAEHWGGRWSIVIEGPAPKHGGKDAFDAAIDAATKKGGAA